jgi:predicted heme/steroid binding protein
MKEMTLEELAKFDGKKTRITYIAYQGKVYDITESPMFEDGVHFDLHSAGGDLTEEMDAAPHGDEVIERFSQVASLKSSPSQ